MHFFTQKLKRFALLQKPSIVMTDLIAHACIGSMYVTVLASIQSQGEGSQGKGSQSSFVTQQNHLFLIFVLAHSGSLS
jgi:hypothetical protein